MNPTKFIVSKKKRTQNLDLIYTDPLKAKLNHPPEKEVRREVPLQVGW